MLCDDAEPIYISVLVFPSKHFFLLLVPINKFFNGFKVKKKEKKIKSTENELHSQSSVEIIKYFVIINSIVCSNLLNNN